MNKRLIQLLIKSYNATYELELSDNLQNIEESKELSKLIKEYELVNNMRLKFKIKEKGDLNSKVLFEIHISLDKWNLWYQEVMRRIQAGNNEVFDVDEVLEMGEMSYKHFKAMDKFLFE